MPNSVRNRRVQVMQPFDMLGLRLPVVLKLCLAVADLSTQLFLLKRRSDLGGL